MSEKFTIFIKNSTLKFNASHAVLFHSENGLISEPLHVHTFHVTVRITGNLDPNGWIADFAAITKSLGEILTQLEGKILLPARNHHVIVEKENGDLVNVRCLGKSYSFQNEEIFLLPLKNVTAELLTRWVTLELMQTLQKKRILPCPDNRYIFQLSLEEEPGCFAEYTYTPEDERQEWNP
ncbi:MAG: 6-carboxytetrahydropterin synthase [Planctomycetaceae bacterium]|jgi:6-pyruvoyl-tetrahydropterin synthase|nr:6-carboxytetrahydropterin synthase [Planctomycetaceae bacterium]